MRRIAVGAALTGVGVLVARALAPKLHARLLAGCERMFEEMPDEFPPKRMMRGIEEMRANTARILELLEERKQSGEAEPLGEASSTRVRGGDQRFGRRSDGRSGDVAPRSRSAT
jgi:hypothetical protein